MNIKKLLIIVAVAIAGAAVFFLVLPRDEVSQTSETRTSTSVMENPSEGGSGQEAGLPTYTMAQVSQHNSRTDCWTVINGSVYDITAYIPRHPGGDEILLACGNDSTSLFTQRQNEDGESVGSGTPHSSQAATELARLKIGELAE